MSGRAWTHLAAVAAGIGIGAGGVALTADGEASLRAADGTPRTGTAPRDRAGPSSRSRAADLADARARESDARQEIARLERALAQAQARPGAARPDAAPPIGAPPPGEARPAKGRLAEGAQARRRKPPPHRIAPLPEPDPELSQLGPFEAARELALPRRGSDTDDTIPIVECVDYDCPYCYRARAGIDKLLALHDDVSFQVLHNPLPMHPDSAIAARAMVAAGRQGRAWQMHEALFDDRHLRSVEGLVAKAESFGLDGGRFELDMMSAEIGREVASHQQVCANADARGTPAFFVGGDLVMGAQGYEALAEAVENERLERG